MSKSRNTRNIQKHTKHIRKSYKQNRNPAQRGGIMIVGSETPKEAFDFFIKNSKIEIFTSSGANGLIIKAILNRMDEKKQLIKSPYKHSNTESYGEPVKQLLIKLCYIVEDNEYVRREKIIEKRDLINHINHLTIWLERAKTMIEDNRKRGIMIPDKNVNEANLYTYSNEVKRLTKILDKYNGVDDDKKITTLQFDHSFGERDKQHKSIQQKSAFTREINIQTEIFLKSLDMLEPLCPAPIYSSVNPNRSAIEFLDTLIDQSDEEDEDDNTASILKFMREFYSNDEGLQLGVLGMEIASEVEILHYKRHVYSRNANAIYILNNMCRMQLIKLALMTGYHHGDFHAGNLLLDTTYTGYYKDELGKPLIIDFGYTARIPKSEKAKIQKLAHEKKYVKILELLYNTPRSDGVLLTDYPDYYEWVTKEPKISEEKMNADLDYLSRQIEEGNRERIEHSKNPHSKLPRLPLSKSDIAEFSLFERGFRKREKLRRQSPQIENTDHIFGEYN